MPEWTGRPVVMNIKAGETIAYCMCGLSKDGPVCDGTHKGTSITPQVGADSRISACGVFAPLVFRCKAAIDKNAQVLVLIENEL